jgi:hypothetical protein
MKFEVVPGIPDVKKVWQGLMDGLTKGSLPKSDRAFAKKFAKAIQHLEENPFHPGLESHDIDALSDRYGKKVFESYLENNTPSAGRIFWVYGPERGQITVIGIEPHPDDKNSAYDRVQLSAMPAPKRVVQAPNPTASHRPKKRKK